ncbi:MAG: TauD/TfdA family dioxygenase [Alphaproteobacteria bacterium]|nr:TauD/TfdA family dioxygenase [Alphaproteobacteria bacterium]MDP6564765.1 TauD/TfdA family dioxygenase [Alphaproteobacteria bacterium]MDP6813308.1 TauD/TfdA family dioxygenase [Alphaproteobacteria bacterium]
MTFEVEPLEACFGAEVRGVKLASIDDGAFAELYDAWLQYALLIFPGQHLTNDEQIAFAKRFGEMEFDMIELSNVREDGSLRLGDDDDMVKILRGNMGWHHDSTYMPVQAKGAVFTAHVVPSSGGETAWADASAAYEALDEGMRQRIAHLSAYHSLHYSQMKAGHTHKKKDSEYFGYGLDDRDPPLRPLVKVHPETGRPTMTIGRHAYGIPGLSEAESESLLQELVDFTCQPPRTHRHGWTPGDVVLWDNRCLLHQACPWDMREARVMYHSRIAGDPESEFAGTA